MKILQNKNNLIENNIPQRILIENGRCNYRL